jgi:hypothetical protein
MTRPVNALAGSLFWLATATLTFSQDQAGHQPCPDVTSETMGCELIAWSRLQEPVPLPDATSPPDRQDRQAYEKERLEKRAKGQESDANPQHQSSQTVTGIIVRNEAMYWLRVNADLTLLLDDQEVAQRYQGRQVNIKGLVDLELKTLRIDSIQSVS